MKNLTRIREIHKIITDLSKRDDLTSEDEEYFDQLMVEFNELRRKDNLSDMDKFMREPMDKPLKPQIPDIGGSDVEPGVVRLYNSSNLEELRSFIRSQDKFDIGENESFSAGRYIRSLITGDWSKAEVEKRAITTTTSGGGYLLPDIVASIIIPMALAKAQIFSGGASSTPMSDKFLTIPKLISMPETLWKKEGEKYDAGTELNFAGLLLEANTLMCLIKISVELAQDSTAISVEKVIEEAMAESIGLEIDRAALLGLGGLEPRGVILTEGILTEDLANNPIESYDFLSRANTKLLNANEKPTALIAPSQMFGDLDLLKDKDENPMKPCPSYAGEGPNRPSYQKLSSNQLEDSAVLADWSKLLIGFRTEIQLDVTDKVSDAFERLEVWLRAFIRIDCGIKRERAFCHIKNYGEVAS